MSCFSHFRVFFWGGGGVGGGGGGGVMVFCLPLWDMLYGGPRKKHTK